MKTGAPRTIAFTVNGSAASLTLPPETPLIYALRNDLGLNGPKFGCGLGECGACTVLIDGRTARSCIEKLAMVEGRAVMTLDGLGSREAPSPVQRAFIDAQGAQCGYCLNGMVMTAQALLDVNPAPTVAEIAHALRYNLCRCGTHVEIIRSVVLAATYIAQENQPL